MDIAARLSFASAVKLCSSGLDTHLDKFDYDASRTSKHPRMTILHKAADKGYASVALKLLLWEELPIFDGRDAHKCTALHYAAWRDDVAICRAILAHHSFSSIKT